MNSQSKIVRSGMLERLLEKYNSTVEVELEENSLKIDGYTYNSSHIMVGGATRVHVLTRFYSKDSFLAFVNDLSEAEKMREEEQIRKNNPTLQQAWEEYQLLLKLSK